MMVLHRKTFGELSTERCVASYVSRFGLCFSSTKKTVDVDKVCVQYTDDIQNDEYCFTDGIGRISTKLAEKVANELNISPVPSAFQIRFGGCKGVVAQDPTLGNNADVLVIRKSMHKFKSDSNNLEILEVTRPGRLHLNRQVITLLSGLGIPDHVFINLQEKMLIDLAEMLLYDEIALPVLLESAVNVDFNLIANKGISLVQEPFFRSLLLAIYHHRITNLMKRTRIQIPLDKGRIMMGTTDETKTLKSGEVFIRYSQQTTRPGKNAITYEGPVVVTKNPCFHEGDVRVFIATNVPELSHMIDCIVFPQKGTRPHPDEMSGSDLDGDMYFVCWDQNLCKFQNKKPMDFPKAEKKQLSRKVSSHDVIDFLADYIRYDKLGLIANAHLVHADSNENGIFSDECHRLAEMHSDAVDFPKTGKIPEIDDDLRPKSYPDFMMKRDKQIYPSTKIIGQLYRQCRSLSRMQKQSGLKQESDVDKDLILPDINAKTLDDAKHQRDQYTSKIVEVLDMYGISNEYEAITGLVLSVKSVKGCLKDEKFQVGQIVKDKICFIQKKTREIFFDEFGGESNISKKDEYVFQKASAWYKVTYMNEKETYRQIRSFPWIVADILVLLKRCHCEPRLNRFEIFLTEYYRLSQTNRDVRDKILKIMYTNVKTLLRSILTKDDELIIIGLELCGLLKSQNNINIATTGLKLKMITEALKEQGIKKTEKPIHDPCYCVTINENAYARFVTDARLIKLSKVMKNHLSKNLMSYKPVVQFLLDVLQDVFPTDSDSYVFSDLIAIMIIFLTSCNNPNDNGCAKCLFGVVKNYILGFRSWNLSKCEVLKDGFEALGMTDTVMSEISDKFLTVFHKTVQNADTNPFLETRKSFGTSQSPRSFEDDDELYGTFPLSLNIWNAIKYSEKHFETQLSKKTGADVILKKTQTGPNRIDAYGSEAALSKVEEIISNISKTPGNLKLYAEKGHCIVEKAYSIIFQGGSEESIVFFQKYHGIHHETHSQEETFVPKIINIRQENNYGDFETKFVKQWHVVKTEYNAIVHGDLFLSISFGILYVMNIERSSRLNVLELNNEFSTLNIRKEQARKPTKRHKKKMKQVLVPYTFSFQPVVLSDIGKIRKVLECIGFSYDNGEIKRKISLRFGDPLYCMQEYGENGELLWVNLSHIKWFMATVVPYFSQNTNIRYKLQSKRDLEGKYISKNNKIWLKTFANGYLLPHSCKIHYAREKKVESYCLTNWFGGYKLKIEVATVTDLHYRQKTGMLVRNGAPRIEILVLPEIPNVSSSEEEIKSYARHIWQWTLKLAAEMEKI